MALTFDVLRYRDQERALEAARSRVVELARHVDAGPTAQQKLREAIDHYDALLACRIERP